MAKLNVKSNPVYTYEGGKASHINPELQLRRSVMACLLWEDNFYEDGVSIAERIANLIPKVKAEKVAEIAVEAREKMKLRHVPLLLVRTMCNLKSHKHVVADTLEKIIQRPDELTEFLAIYWKDKREPLSAQVKKGLARAFVKFNEYSLAKYDQDGKIKLRDVLFLCHAKPKDKAQEKVWKHLIKGELKIPDTWEVELSAGKDKKKTWERLLKEEKLGALALLRNLRNMEQVGVKEKIIFDALRKIDLTRVLPFRFITAARYAPQWEPQLEEAMMKALESKKKITGKTVLLIDVSSSMYSKISNKSEITGIDAACGLAILIREICNDVNVYTFSERIVPVPPRHGFALRDAIKNSQGHNGTYLGKAVKVINSVDNTDRIIVITDEQSRGDVPSPVAKSAYIVNVSTNKNGVGYGSWTKIDGWSESIIDHIFEIERKP